MSGGSVAATVPLVPAPVSHRKRWIAGLIVAFILGFLLAWFLKKCPKSPNDGGSGSATASVSGSETPKGPGSPIKLGKGSGTPGEGGAGDGGGNIQGGGRGSGEGSGDADIPNGPNAPSGTPDSAGPDINQNANDYNSPAASAISALAGGDDKPGAPPSDTVPPNPPPGPVLTAKDFSYDSTGLPRYSSGIQGVASGVATDTIRHRKSTIAAIVTNDSFDSVVTWYKSQAPAGWQAQSMGDMGAVASALSPEAIMGMLSGASSGKQIDTTAINTAMKGSGDMSVAMLEPPNQTTDPRSIMIVKRKGKPTEIMMSKKLQQ